MQSCDIDFNIVMDKDIAKADHAHEFEGQLFDYVLVLLKELNTLTLTFRVAKIVLADEMARDVDDNLYRFEQTVMQSPFEVTV